MGDDEFGSRFAKSSFPPSDPSSPDAESVSLPEARRLAKERSIKIIAAFSRLSEIIGRHEGMIQKRWMKKDRAQRLRILLKAWPNMPKMHRPDTQAHQTELRRSGSELASESRQAYLWPYINQEDLLKSHHFLLLLNARGRNSPLDFSYFDLDAMFYGHFWEGIDVRVIPDGYKMILNHVTIADARNYAMIIPCGLLGEGQVVGSYHMPGDHQFTLADGLMILEAQERLMGFLVECCEEILHDNPSPVLISDTLPISAIEDHFWALREDPGYFAEQLEETTDHLVPEMFLGIKDRLAQGGIPWNSEALHRKYCPDNTLPANVPEDYMHAVLRFRFILQRSIGQFRRVRSDVGPDENRVLPTAIIYRGLCVYLDELERLLQTDEAAKRLISPRLARPLGELFAAGVSQTIAKDDLFVGGALFQLLSQPRVPQRTPDVRDVDDIRLGGLAISNFQGEFDTSSNQDAFKKLDISHRNPKPKTRGIAHQTPSPQITHGTSVEAESEAQKGPQRFAVSARALKVFRTLFYDPSTTSTPG
ncbi:hypothetical protein B0T22DRAFT_442499 [Podospora appendiculata]|uniref:Uncharacterized protein n=1 Tax=Podospora appendiculata TaxID=314037 RepID=A0AAE0X5G1_9PEZI|nr:hypothetical protein B0T22DRAFT_442499 [Podospora appendiculata]